jgi:N-acetylmuramic acid 6-phosphate etherase
MSWARDAESAADLVDAMTGLPLPLTEGHRPELADLNLRSPQELLELMNAESRSVPGAIEAAHEALVCAISAIIPRIAHGGRLIYQGAGSAGRIGALDAAECGPTFNTDQVVAVMAGGPGALTHPVESAEDRVQDGERDLRGLGVSAADVVVGVSASGRTPYVIGGIEHARSVGALTVAVVCNADAPLSRLVDVPIEVLVGPEVIAGSTRLKAGTAQKLVLNAISTIVMVKLNKTYGNLMVNVRATNTKLLARAERMLASATGRQGEEVRPALRASGNDVRLAMMMLVGAIDRDEASARLEASGGDLRSAIDKLRRGG